jgi:hypothetical protein
MKSVNLVAELYVAQGALTTEHRHTLRALGIPDVTVARGFVGVARILPDKRGTYQPIADGCVAFVTPVRIGVDPSSPEDRDFALVPQYGELIDLVAWSPRDPRRWATRCDYGTWLGAIPPQYVQPEAVPMRRSPLSWLRADGTGLCVLARERIEGYRLLSLCGQLRAEDRQHQRELHDILARPFPVPPITIAAPAQPRAA